MVKILESQNGKQMRRPGLLPPGKGASLGL